MTPGVARTASMIRRRLRRREATLSRQDGPHAARGLGHAIGRGRLDDEPADFGDPGFAPGVGVPVSRDPVAARGQLFPGDHAGDIARWDTGGAEEQGGPGGEVLAVGGWFWIAE